MSPRALLVTASDERYRRCLFQLLASVERVGIAATVAFVAVDLGLAPHSRARLGARFPWVQWDSFPFEEAPPFARLRPRATNTNGWKPLAIRRVLEARGMLARDNGDGAPVLWFDAACVLVAPLDAPLAWLDRHGVYVPYGGQSTLGERTHPEAIRVERLAPAAAHERMRASGVVGLNVASPHGRFVLDAWCDGCRDERLLCPPGATLSNHRFDQSVLNFVLERPSPFGRLASRASEDALDISSAAPVPWLRSRNKVPVWMPERADRLARAYYAMHRHADIMKCTAKEALLEAIGARAKT